MKKFIYYLLGIIFSPSKTFEKIADDKNHTPYILIIFTSSVVLGLINSFLTNPQYDSTLPPIVKAINDFVWYLQKSQPILGPIGWIFSGIVIHTIATNFFSKKKRKLSSLLVASGLIGFIGSPTVLATHILGQTFSILTKLSLLVVILLFYLQALALSKLYG